MKKIKLLLLVTIVSILPQFSVFAASTCNHKDTIHVDKQEPTCLDNGYEEGEYCDKCHLYISGHEKINEIGHIDKNGDGICDDCGMEFEIKPAQKATCTKDGYTGDKEVNGRIVMGKVIPAKGHKDTNFDYICDVCGCSINKEKITVTLHYYLLNEDYKNHKSDFENNNVKVADSKEIPNCKYIEQKIQATQGIEFDLPDFPAINKYVFTWIDNKGTIYTKYISNRDIDLYMAFVESGKDDKTGQCGDNAYWRWFPEEEILYFYGSGSVWTDYTRVSDLPWGIYINEAKKTVIYPGVSIRMWMVSKS